MRREDLLLGDDVDIDEGAAHLVVRADVGLDVLDAPISRARCASMSI